MGYSPGYRINNPQAICPVTIIFYLCHHLRTRNEQVAVVQIHNSDDTSDVAEVLAVAPSTLSVVVITGVFCSILVINFILHKISFLVVV